MDPRQLEMIPDPRDTMAELTKALDGEGDSYVKRFAVLILSFPQDYAHALCRIAAGLDDASSIADIAKACRIHRSTAQRHIEKAKRMLKHIQDLQNAADEIRNRADSLLEWGEGRGGTPFEGSEGGEGGYPPV